MKIIFKMPFLQDMLVPWRVVNLDDFPRVRGENKTYLKPPPRLAGDEKRSNILFPVGVFNGRFTMETFCLGILDLA